MTVEYNKENDIDEIFTGNNWTGTIEYTAEYAMYVEFETAYAGSKPPFEPIYEWTRRNWGDISQGVKDVAERDGQTREEHIEATAWVIVESIAESGTEGVHFGKRSIEKGREKADAVARKHAGKPNAPKLIARDMADLMFAHSQDIINEEASDSGSLARSGGVTFEEGDNE